MDHDWASPFGSLGSRHILFRYFPFVQERNGQGMEWFDSQGCYQSAAVARFIGDCQDLSVKESTLLLKKVLDMPAPNLRVDVGVP